VILLEKFDVNQVFDAIDNMNATLFFGVPTMYSRLVESSRVEKLRELRLCVSGSAPLPASMHRQLEQRAGQRVLERYGMTETVMLLSNLYEGERRAGSVGVPLPGVEARIDASSGELCVRGPNVFGGYFNRPDANRAAFTHDGYFRTGDLCSLSHDGFYTLNGRASELIISGGFNIYPREIEDVLRQHELIQDVAVTGD
jgi:malonyl-CoA/methylmalonyl-CoA synthetase